MSRRLYYDDCYLPRFEATAQVAEDGRVYLDQTAFYPTSGGQPHDLGFINGHPVLDVIDETDRIAHLLTGTLAPGPVDCVIDWARRYDHMQQHTAQHLISALFQELHGCKTLSFHLGEYVSTIELEARHFTEAELHSLAVGANQIVREARSVRISYDEADSVQGLRKASARTGTLRLITIEGLDRSACGGTHVHSTAELAPIQLRGLEKIRGHVRVEYVAGDRALRRAQQDYRLLAALARSTSTSLDQVAASVASLGERLAKAEKDSRVLKQELGKLEGEQAYARVQPAADGCRRLALPVPVIDDGVRATVQSFVARGQAIVVAHTDVPGSVLVVCSADIGVDAGKLLKQTLASTGASGGGSATQAQGKLPTAEALAHLFASLGFQ